MSTNADGCPPDEALVTFVEGSLEVSRMDGLERHLDRCPRCRSVVGFLGPQTETSASGMGTYSLRHKLAGSVLAIGATVGRYRIEAVRGRGAMGVVYVARDRDLDRAVALKVLRVGGASELDRIIREARLLASVTHPNVVEIYDVLDGGVIAMELVDGRDLRAWMKEAEARDYASVVSVFAAAGKGLAATHARGVVHRDVKPDNILFDVEGRVRLTDFGLATEVVLEWTPGPQADTTVEPGLARPQAGTPAYMAPEVLGGSVADARSDQFSFCVALFEALLGRRPFTNTDRSTPVDFGGRRLPRRLVSTLARGLQVSPYARFENMNALVDALERSVSPRLGRRAVLATALAGAVTVALTMLGTASRPPCHEAEARLSARWDGGAVERVQQRLGAQANPYAQETGERVATALRRYQHAWTEVGVAACAEAPSAPTVACLDRLAATFDAATSLLAHADPTAVDHAVSMVESLPSPVSCTQPGGPGDTTLSPVQVAALTNAGAYLEMDDTAEASAVLDEFVRLHPDSDPSTRARLAYYRGVIAAEQGQHEEAETRLAEAYWSAERYGQRDLAARASTRLIAVIGSGLGRPGDADSWAIHAEHAARATGSTTLHARYLHTLAELRSIQGRGNDARDLLERAVDMLEAQTGPKSVRTLQAIESLGHLSAHHDDYVSARAHYERALAGYREVLGDEHPAVADVLVGLSTCASATGDPSRALELARDVVAGERARRGRPKPGRARHLATLGEMAYGAGDIDLALESTTQALTIYRQTSPAGHRGIAHTLLNLGIIHARPGEHAKARGRFLEALDLLESRDDIDPALMGTLLTNLALSEVRLADPEGAKRHYARSIRVFEDNRGPDALLLVHPLTGLGGLLIAQGETARGLQTLERAYRISTSMEARPPLRANAAFTLAKALATGDAQPRQVRRAIELARESRRIYLDLGPGSDLMRGDVETWLAFYAPS